MRWGRGRNVGELTHAGVDLVTKAKPSRNVTVGASNSMRHACPCRVAGLPIFLPGPSDLFGSSAAGKSFSVAFVL
jgi:hypothetical protein